MSRHSSLMFGAAAVVLVGAVSHAFAFVYSEHKSIGEKAFRNFARQLAKDHAFPTEDAAYAFFAQHLETRYDKETEVLYFTRLSNPPNEVSYGVLNALSGDYEESLLTLNEGLAQKYSSTNQIIHLQDASMENFKDSAERSDILKIKPSFAYLALKNYGHFFDYGSSLEDHIREFEKTDLERLKAPKSAQAVFQELNASTLLREYLTLHAFAIHLAQEAGKSFEANREKSDTYLSYAFMYNAFADHFLEDGFASGHLVVHRTIFGGIINNKALHDFYNKTGVTVMNLDGDIWKTYGDHDLFKGLQNWKNADSYERLAWKEMPEHAQRVTEAVTQSLLEVWQAFDQARHGSADSLISRIPDDENRLQDFFIKNFKTISLMPVPFGSELDLDDYHLDPSRVPDLKRVNALLGRRNFVRTRVANSVIIDLGQYDMFNDPMDLYGARLNMSGWNSYSDRPDKTGSMDHWLGYTVSATGASGKGQWPIQQYKAGGTYNGDIWVSPKRYFGIYSYLEGGVQNRNDRAGYRRRKYKAFHGRD